MKSLWSIAIATLPCLVVACSGPAPVKPVESPNVSQPPVAHASAPDATTVNAGAARCTMQAAQVGALAKDGGVAIGFGQRGGLIAWTSPEGMRVKSLTTAGAPNGAAVPISFPKGAVPVQVVAVGRGFAVIAKRVDSHRPCDAKPADAKAGTAKPAEAKPGETKPAEAKPAEASQAPCEKPGHEFLVQLTDLDGRNASAGRPFETDLIDIETIIPGDGSGFGVITKNDVIWIRVRDDGRLDAHRVDLPRVAHVVPVRGSVQPAIVLVNNDGSMQLMDERGTQDINGKFAVAPKPSADVRFVSHWAPNRRIEVVRQAGDSTQYAVIDKLEMRVLGDSDSQGIRESFKNYVEARMENGQLRRLGWDKRPVGGDIDPREVDKAADLSRSHFVWTGSAFVFAHPSTPPHRADAQAASIVVANCAGGGR